MEEALLSLINGVPIAAAVMYVWIVSEKSHNKEIEAWREMVQQKDDHLNAMQDVINSLAGKIGKLIYIIENYVITGRKNFTGEQDQRP